MMLPGTVGGAVFMNAETLGESFGDHVESVTWFDKKTLALMTAMRDQMPIWVSQQCVSASSGCRDYRRKTGFTKKATRRRCIEK